MRRLLIRVFYGSLVGFTALVALLYLLIGTPTGSRWLLGFASHLTHGQFTFTASQGSLLKGLRIEGLRWHTTTLDVRMIRAGVKWRPLDLFEDRLEIKALAAEHVLIVYQAATANQKTPSTSRPFVPPLSVHIAALRIDDLIIVDQQRVFRIAQIRGELGLTGKRLNLTSLTVATPQGEIALTGHLLLAQSTRLDLQTTWNWQFTSGGRIDGQGKLQGPLSKLAVTQDLTHPFPVTLIGRIDIPNMRGTAHISWQKARWPLIGKAEFSSPAGTLKATGGLSAYHLSLSASLKAGTQAIPHLGIEVEGNRQGLRLKQLEANLFGGKLEATGAATWLTALSWRLDLKGSALNPGSRWAAWPGQLNLSLQLKGDARQVNFSLTRLDGKLRHWPVAGQSQGQIDLAKRRLTLSSMHLSALDAVFDLKGIASPSQGQLQYSLNIPKLKVFTPEAEGHLKLSGTLDGPWAWPRVHAQLEGGSLHFRDLAVHLLMGTITQAQGQNLNARLDLTEVKRGSLLIKEIRLRAQGNPSAHTLSLTARSARAQLLLSLEGGLTNDDSKWRGRLIRLGIRAPGNIWQLNRPAAIDLSRQVMSVSPVCLQAGKDTAAHLCTELKNTPQHLHLTADWSRIPIALIDPFLPQSVHAGGHLSGHVTLSGPTHALSGTFSTQATDAFLESGEGKNKVHYALSLTRLSATLHARQIAVILKAGLPAKGVVDAQMNTGLAANAPLNGHLHLMLPDLAFVNPLLPDLRDIGGALKVDLALSGTRKAPGLGVQATLSNGTFTLPQTGIHLSHIEASLTGQPPARILNIALKAQSGPGTLNATGKIDHWMSGDPQIQLKIDGQRFEAVNLPQVTALISPALTLDASRKVIRVRGKIEIPQASIHLKSIPPGSVNVSEDTRIVGEQAPTQAPGPLRDISVELVLGQAVKIDAFGLTGQLAGAFLLNQRNNAPPSADGSLHIVNGTYAAYGLKLAISRGVINFAGPVDNPGLDFVAERQTGNVTAQLAVTGTLKSPHSQVSAIPPMSESEALSWLITGHGLAGSSKSDAALLLKALASMHLDQGGGNGGLLSTLKTQTGLSEIGVQGGESLQQSALLLGKYLTPDLYVRYSAGLFDHSNALALTYQLSRHLSVEAKSGTAQGIDLLYQIVFGPR